jgi:hypothetical protein
MKFFHPAITDTALALIIDQYRKARAIVKKVKIDNLLDPRPSPHLPGGHIKGGKDCTIAIYPSHDA